MRKVLLSIIVFCLALAPNFAFAETKIGIVNFEDIINNSPAGKKAKAGLEKMAKSTKAALEKDQAELKKLQDEIQNKSMGLSEDAKRKKVEEFRTKYLDFQRKTQEFQRKLAEEEKKVLQPIFDTLLRVTQEYGKKHDFTIILEQTNAGVAWA